MPLNKRMPLRAILLVFPYNPSRLVCTFSVVDDFWTPLQSSLLVLCNGIKCKFGTCTVIVTENLRPDFGSPRCFRGNRKFLNVNSSFLLNLGFFRLPCLNAVLHCKCCISLRNRYLQMRHVDWDPLLGVYDVTNIVQNTLKTKQICFFICRNERYFCKFSHIWEDLSFFFSRKGQCPDC